jgi:hypothetical protein
MIPKKPVPDLIRDGNRFPAYAKPASAGEGRSDKIMRKQDVRDTDQRSDLAPSAAAAGRQQADEFGAQDSSAR